MLEDELDGLAGVPGVALHLGCVGIDTALVVGPLGESMTTRFRTVQGVRTTASASSGQPRAASARRQPQPMTRRATTRPARKGRENGRTRADSPRTAPKASRRARVGGPVAQSWVTTTATAARAKRMNAVSSWSVAV